jgi:glutaconate CoA-transferase, subunit B
MHPEEVMIAALRRLIGDARHVAIGANSPMPLAAAFLAGAENGVTRVLLQQKGGDLAFSDGGVELFDAAGQGRIDVFFLSGVQIDGAANINLVATGDYRAPAARFPGSYGSAYMYFTVPRVILFRTEHSRRALVPRVDFISAPGTSPPGVWRRGGPVALVTPLCGFAFDAGRARFRLESIHPGHDLAEVMGNTGFDFDRPETVPATPAPSDATLALLRGPVAERVAPLYPAFVQKIWA